MKYRIKEEYKKEYHVFDEKPWFKEKQNIYYQNKPFLLYFEDESIFEPVEEERTILRIKDAPVSDCSGEVVSFIDDQEKVTIKLKPGYDSTYTKEHMIQLVNKWIDESDYIIGYLDEGEAKESFKEYINGR